MMPNAKNQDASIHITLMMLKILNQGEMSFLHTLGRRAGKTQCRPLTPHILAATYSHAGLPSGKCTAMRQNSQTQEQLLPTHTGQLISRVISETISAQYHRNSWAQLYPQLIITSVQERIFQIMQIQVGGKHCILHRTNYCMEINWLVTWCISCLFQHSLCHFFATF